jgi:putative addiction module killer protein
MNTLRRTEEFMAWITKLKDVAGKARIAARLKLAAAGSFGDHKSVGQGVMEMRIHTGPGYRVYYAQEGATVYLLLIGGDKSTQEKDIRKAQELWAEIKEG